MAEKRPILLQVTLLAASAAAAAVAARYYTTKNINCAETLSESLLDTDRLKDAVRDIPEMSEGLLAACAAYFTQFAARVAEGQGMPGSSEDIPGFSRTKQHPFTHSIATVITEENTPEQKLTYAVVIPSIGEVRGTRRTQNIRLALFPPSRPVFDTLQITLPNDYTAQIETELLMTESLSSWQTRLYGTAVLRDNRGNVGRFHIAMDGQITGAVTRDAHVIGRFEGKAPSDFRFRQYEIGSAPDAKEEKADVKEETTDAEPIDTEDTSPE